MFFPVLSVYDDGGSLVFSTPPFLFTFISLPLSCLLPFV